MRVGINGFGRIGRNIMRAALGNAHVEVVAVNDLMPPSTLAHLLKYDSVLGPLPARVIAKGTCISIDDLVFTALSVKDPTQLPWKALGVDVVLEATGAFTSRCCAARHLTAGARKVVVTAPSKGADVTIVLGVNDEMSDPRVHRVISNASCTTNCLAPIAKVLHERFGIRKGWISTVHSYTSDQRLLDLPHQDLRRSRAAGLSIIPTTTGAAVAVGEVLPELKGRLDGMSMRVPTPDVSAVDLTVLLDTSTTAAEVNQAFETAATGPLKGILAVSTEELVSVDFKGAPFSAIVDAPCTRVMDGDFVKVLAWYDNEWGYANRCVDLIERIARDSRRP